MISKILVIRFSSIGDIVLVTPVLRALRQAFPEAETWVLVKEEYTPILNGNPHITGVIPLETQGKHKGIKGLMGLIRTLRAEGFDLVIDLHANLRSFLVTALMGAPEVPKTVVAEASPGLPKVVSDGLPPYRGPVPRFPPTLGNRRGQPLTRGISR